MTPAPPEPPVRRGTGHRRGQRSDGPSLREIAVAFQSISLLSFGGGLSAWARLVLVEKRGWLTDQGFLEALSLIEPLPGPNAVQLASFVGGQLRGIPGIAAAVGGLLGLPLVLTMTAGMVYFDRRPGPLLNHLNDALRGIGLVAAGMGFSLAIRLLLKERDDRVFVLFAAITFIAIAFVHLSLVLVSAVGILAAFLANTYRHHG